MKYSAAIATAVAAGLVQAKPQFTNSNFEVTEGKAFPIEFSGCPTASPCTISLKNGPSTDLKTVQVLTSDATDATGKTGGSFSWTPSGLPSGTYAFEIKTNGNDAEINYSSQFSYQGTGTLSVTSGSSSTSTSVSVTASSSSSSSSASDSSSITSSVSASASSSANATSITSSITSMSNSTSRTASMTGSASDLSSATTSAPSVRTSVPGNSASLMGPSMGIFAAAVAALIHLV